MLHFKIHFAMYNMQLLHIWLLTPHMLHAILYTSYTYCVVPFVSISPPPLSLWSSVHPRISRPPLRAPAGQHSTTEMVMTWEEKLPFSTDDISLSEYSLTDIRVTNATFHFPQTTIFSDVQWRVGRAGEIPSTSRRPPSSATSSGGSAGQVRFLPLSTGHHLQ